MAEVFEREFDFQKMITLKVNREIDCQNMAHSSTSLVQIETIANLKQQQDFSRMSVQETNSDLKKEEDSSTTIIEKDYSGLKPEEVSFRTSKKETDSKSRMEECSSTNPKKETNSKLKKGEICSHCHKKFVTRDILMVHKILAHSKPQIKLKRVDNLLSKYQSSVTRNSFFIHEQKN